MTTMTNEEIYLATSTRSATANPPSAGYLKFLDTMAVVLIFVMSLGPLATSFILGGSY